MATIHDVAALAGVSVSSVSNVLSGRTDKLGAETYRRVEAAISQLNYRPNRAARQLKTGHTPMLGLLVPSTANPMYGQLALKIEAAAQERYGYRLLLANTHRDKQHEARMFEDLLSFGVQSVIVVSSMDDERHLENAVARGLAVVSYDRSIDLAEHSQVDHVSPDNFQAGYIATDHLIAHGHTRLAFLVPGGKTVSRSNKVAGFLKRVSEAGLQGSSEVIEGQVAETFGDSELADLGFAMASQIKAMRPMPTGIVTVNDLLAIGLMAGLHQVGLHVPQDVSVVGMDGLSIAAFTNPGLTSVSMPLDAMADAMVQRVVERSQQLELPPINMIFQPDLVGRQSVATPANS
ncbi:substrate-binding domain-containing protein [Pseudomonas umsongensis]|jgi:DNA-binding LacI/PurR family transcriptional regulator|uniref:LacI family DNA-binding transcriptional regulator n=1 Tax=Pseudomonas umsongensis TaxID=198618 RepID=UPI0012489C76|nr:LacI family DNA-binding transcriptional regulator [Pseudomonas umsongensis]QFG30117.1 substrate-binding domain-containing protein [Pseudomonas umsongensis]